MREIGPGMISDQPITCSRPSLTHGLRDVYPSDPSKPASNETAEKDHMGIRGKRRNCILTRTTEARNNVFRTPWDKLILSVSFLERMYPHIPPAKSPSIILTRKKVSELGIKNIAPVNTRAGTTP